MEDFSDLVYDRKKREQEFIEDARKLFEEWNEFYEDWKKKEKLYRKNMLGGNNE